MPVIWVLGAARPEDPAEQARSGARRTAERRIDEDPQTTSTERTHTDV